MPMKRALSVVAVAILTLAASGLTLAQTRPAKSGSLEFYWIDVEGGASTLIVSPAGDSLLFDTGYMTDTNRDAKRIFAAAQKAGLKQVDHVVISHLHGDHVCGLSGLSQMIS